MKTPLEKIKARIQVAEKELEIGYELVCNGRTYTRGDKLDTDQLNGRKYMLECNKKLLADEEEKYLESNPLPF